MSRWIIIFSLVVVGVGAGGCGGSESGNDGTGGSSSSDVGADTSSSSGGGTGMDDTGGSSSGSDAGGGWSGEDTGSWSGADTSADAGSWGGADTGSPEEDAGGNTNVNFGGEQDFGYFRALLDNNQVPRSEDFDASGFFAEHHTPLPAPDCGERICLQTMFGVLGNLINGNNCTMLQLGLNSPLTPDPSNRPPLTLAVVVDVSGSMRGDRKLEFVRNGLEQLIDALRDDDQIAIITYSDVARLEFPMSEVSLNRGRLREIIRAMTPDGGTNVYDGLELGYQTVFDAYDSGRQNRLIFLSDGEATAGNTSNSSILDMSSSYNSDGVGITTVGLGTGFNRDLMRGLAEQGDGNFYFLEDAGAVDEVFQEEISYFTVPVAFDLTLEMSSGSWYELGAVHGTTRFEASGDGGRLEIPSVFLAHRESHDDVTDSGGRRGGGSALLVELMPRVDAPGSISEAQVAEVLVTFREPGTNRIVEQQTLVNYPHSPLFVADGGFFESPDLAIIHKSFVMLNIFVGFQMASDAFYSGEGEAAVEMMERLLAAVEDYNEEIGDVDMEYDIELMEQFIDVMIANGAIPPAEPEIPEDPWPCD